jgi:hypothetical protein
MLAVWRAATLERLLGPVGSDDTVSLPLFNESL